MVKTAAHNKTRQMDMLSLLRKLARFITLAFLSLLLLVIGLALAPEVLKEDLGNALTGTRSKPARTAADKEAVDVLAAPLRMHWDEAAQRNGFPVPALELLVLPADVVDRHESNYFWSPGNKVVVDAARTVSRLAQAVLVPDAESFPLGAMGALCEEPVDDKAFSGCQSARGILTLHRDENGAPYVQVAADSKPLVARDFDTPRPLKSIDRYAFFTERRAGRDHFAGWDCDSPGLRTVLESGRLYGHARCLAETPPHKRWLPFAERREKHHALVVCQENAPCHLHFLFNGRYARLTAAQVPEEAPEAGMLQLLVSAWTRLDRQRASAKEKSSATAALYSAEASTQTEACIALAAEAEIARTAQPFRELPLRQTMTAPCRKAAFLASTLAERAPAEAAGLFARLLPVLLRMADRDDDIAVKLFPTWFAALEKSGKGKSPEMLSAMLQQLPYLASGIWVPQGPDTPDGKPYVAPASAYDTAENRAREAFLRKAWTLARQFPATRPDMHDKLFEALAWHLSTTKQIDATKALYQEKLEHLKTREDGGPELVEFTRQLAYKQWYNGDFAGLRATLDELAPLWLEHAPNVTAADGIRALGRMKDAGFALVLLNGAWGRNQNKAYEAGAAQDRILAPMANLYGEADAYVRASRCEKQSSQGAWRATNVMGCGYLNQAAGRHTLWRIE